jgi:tRNA threonylcarbamoyladenosine modification (KEOPS) complex  Pcc1 subunit
LRKKGWRGIFEKESALPLLRKQDDLQAEVAAHESACRMMRATITVDKDVENVYSAILPELREHPRSSIKVEKGSELTFRIEAEDVASLRASLNTITQMLAVYFKVREVA